MSNLTYKQIARGSGEENSVLRIQDQYKKYFFVPFTQLERASEDGHILVAILNSRGVGYAWAFCNEGVVRIRYHQFGLHAQCSKLHLQN